MRILSNLTPSHNRQPATDTRLRRSRRGKIIRSRDRHLDIMSFMNRRGLIISVWIIRCFIRELDKVSVLPVDSHPPTGAGAGAGTAQMMMMMTTGGGFAVFRRARSRSRVGGKPRGEGFDVGAEMAHEGFQGGHARTDEGDHLFNCSVHLWLANEVRSKKEGQNVELTPRKYPAIVATVHHGLCCMYG